MDGFAGYGFGSSTFKLIVTTTLLTALVILVNGGKQALFKKRNEPPVVFHWFPFVGSAFSYGQEPNRFLNDCQAKVRMTLLLLEQTEYMLSHLLTTLAPTSTAISSHLCFSAEELQHTWGSTETILS